MILLKNQTGEQLTRLLEPFGVRPRLARRIQASVLRRNAWPDGEPEISSRALDRVRERAGIPNLVVRDKKVSSQDGFARYVFSGDGPELFEAVRIPLLHRADAKKYIVCVSSQVGCALGCVFCRTGKMGFRRDLSTWEIVDQVVKIQFDSPHPVRGVVFMGMGEPMLNYDAVIQAARIFSEPCGLAIAAKAITVSTAGIAPAIRRFTAERHPYRLLVSLTSADPAKRRALMPVENRHSTADLMAALRDYHKAMGGRLTLAWTMMAGINTMPDDARQLAELTRGLPVKLDLIDVNDDTGRYVPPTAEELAVFRDALRAEMGAPVARRYSGGQDIQAACGQLTAEYRNG